MRKKAIENPNLKAADIELFDKMRGNYISENEKKFFEELEYKEEMEVSYSYDWLLFENENEDNILFFRQTFSEYAIDREVNDRRICERHFSSLSEVLNINLKQYGYLDRDITFWQWLRERDYAGIRYDRDGDWDD